MTTKMWLLQRLNWDVREAEKEAQTFPEPWSMRLHMLKRCIALVSSGPDEPGAVGTERKAQP